MAEGGGGQQPDESAKTEEPSPRRLEQAREKGQVAVSREVNTWLILLAGTMIVVAWGGAFLTQVAVACRAFLEHAHALEPAAIAAGVQAVGLALALPLGGLMLAAFVGPFAQVGPLFSTEPLVPKLSKISPLAGFGRLFSWRSGLEFAKGIAKIAIVGVVGWFAVGPFLAAPEHMVGLPMGDLLGETRFLTLRMLAAVLIALLILVVADLAYVRFSHYQKMRMSKQEVRDELKQTEGDPMIRARLRALRAQRARQRMMAAVPEADVVVANPTHYAVALKYDPGAMAAPVCVAKGRDLVALRIIEVARAAGVEVVRNAPLARALHAVVELDAPIPAEQYRAVAEVISYVFKRRGRGL
jgi:flagellar biosynthesis protein FlhB